MPTIAQQWPTTDSPLEEFIRRYAEAIGGAWEEVEPQVYDLLLPPGELGETVMPSENGVLRLAFDPEAIPEHPGAQLASLGTPLVDRLLTAAVERGQFARAYFNGLNLSPHDLLRRVGRALTLPEGMQLECERIRRLHVPQAVYWFEATFESDQKEQEVLSIGIDLGTGREVRHMEQLLDFSRLSEEPAEYLIEGRHMSMAAAYPLARDQALRTLSSLANLRRRELTERVDRQSNRMGRYYQDLRSEIGEQMERARKRGDDVEKLRPRLDALDREERLRMAELRQKSTLRVRLRLTSLLVIQQPKLLVKTKVRCDGNNVDQPGLDLLWDPLVEHLEAVACSRCGCPTYVLELNRRQLTCPGCARSFAGKR